MPAAAMVFSDLAACGARSLAYELLRQLLLVVHAPVVVQRQVDPHGLADHAENCCVSAVAAHRQGLRRGLAPKLMS